MKDSSSKKKVAPTVKEKHEAVFKGILRLLKKHDLPLEVKGLLFKKTADPGVMEAANDGCIPPCQNGYECVTVVDPITYEQRNVCLRM